MTLTSLRDRLPVDATAIRAGLARAWLPGRFQVIPGPVEWILDVAHNPAAAAVLADHLETGLAPDALGPSWGCWPTRMPTG